MLLRALFLFALTLAAYSFVLESPFKFLDDQFSIVNNPLIKDGRSLGQLFQQGYFNDHSYYRPLVNVSYMLEYKLFGLQPLFYHLDNILIHIANALLVWALAAVLINRQAGFWVALLFAIHPIQWESVSNISGRAILLSTFFALISFNAFVRGRMFAALLAFALGLLCKESTAILPAVLVVYRLLNGGGIRFLWPWAVIVAVYAVLRKMLGMTETFHFERWQDTFLAFLTFLKSVVIDVRLLLLPLNLYFDRSLEMYKSPGELEALMVMAIYLITAVLLGVFWKSMTGLQKLCLAWFALCLLPVSQLVTSIGVQPGYISTAEHFLYMACIPFFCVIVAWLYPRRNLIVNALASALIIFFFLMTVAQNLYASNEIVMLKRSLKNQPHNARLHSSLGLIYALSKDFKQAESHFALAVAGDPGSPRYRISLGKSLCDQGRYAECLKVYDEIKDPGGFAQLLSDNRAAAVKAMHAQTP